MKSTSTLPHGELESLCNALADGLLDESGIARLEALLKGHAEARRQYRHFMMLHASLHWDYAAAANPAPPAPPKDAGRRWTLPALLTLVTGIALVVGGVLALWAPKNPPLVEVLTLSGAVTWTDGQGMFQANPAPGTRLKSGTLATEGEGASAQVRFRDGTVLVLGGESEILFRDDGQKRLILQRGTFTAHVAPQPAGRPMLVRTPSAEAEVLGTVFALAAEPTETLLNVQSGEVLLRRLADGQTVHVGESRGVIASLDVTKAMTPERPPDLPTQWTRTYDEPPPPGKGEWLPAPADGSGTPGRIRAVSYVAGRVEQQRPIIHHGMSCLAPPGGPRAFVALQEGSVLRLTCRTNRAVPLKVLISTLRHEGTFGGNFEVKLPPGPAHEWQTLEIPLARFEPLMPAREPHFSGRGVRLLLVDTFQHDAGLEVAALAIGPP
jgi:ferric-dicitrate binding protein FerR (iron transport regulator)